MVFRGEPLLTHDGQMRVFSVDEIEGPDCAIRKNVSKPDWLHARSNVSANDDDGSSSTVTTHLT